MRQFQTSAATLITLCASCAFFFALSAQGASFECRKAKSKVEHIICDNAEISKLDDELSVAYKAALKNEKQANLIRKSQKQWQKIRATIGDADLLKSFYKSRIQLLTSGAQLLKEADKYRFELSARAGEEGSQDKVAVCRDMLASLKKLNKQPMVCGQEFHPSFKQFTYPVWKKLDPREYRDLILQIYDNEYKRDEIHDKTEPQEIRESNKKERQASRVWLGEQLARGEGSLYIATIPLHKEPRQVLSFALDTLGYGKCDGVDPESAYPRRYFIVDMVNRRIDFEAMEDEYHLFGDSLAISRNSTLFLHNGIPYTAFWDESLMFAHSELWINAEPSRYEECFIEYNEDGRPYHD